MFREWRASQDMAELHKTLNHLIDWGRIRHVNKIVCIGLGSLMDDYDRPKRGARTGALESPIRRAPCTQHAAAITMARMLRRQAWGGKVELFAVDMDYREEDKAALRAFGFDAILSHEYGRHEGYLKIDSDTMVFSVNAGYSLQTVVLETSRPALMIWTDRGFSHQLRATRAAEILFGEYDHVPCSVLAGTSGIDDRFLGNTNLRVRKERFNPLPAPKFASSLAKRVG